MGLAKHFTVNTRCFIFRNGKTTSQ